MAKKPQHKAEPVRSEPLEVPPRQDPAVNDKVWFGRIYWAVGPTPKGMTRNDVTNPPVNGWQSTFVLPGEKAWTTFDPFLFQSNRITVGGYEQKSFEGAPNPFTKEGLIALLTRKWEEHAAAGAQVDYDIAAKIIKELGGQVPTTVPSTTRTEEPDKERGGKPAEPELLKPVKRGGKRGKVLEWFLGNGARSIREAMAEFDASRSSVLSYLHNLHKDHGIGYRLVGDTAEVELPGSCESPWEDA